LAAINKRARKDPATILLSTNRQVYVDQLVVGPGITAFNTIAERANPYGYNEDESSFPWSEVPEGGRYERIPTSEIAEIHFSSKVDRVAMGALLGGMGGVTFGYITGWVTGENDRSGYFQTSRKGNAEFGAILCGIGGVALGARLGGTDVSYRFKLPDR
jgi:hypothetical protein